MIELTLLLLNFFLNRSSNGSSDAGAVAMGFDFDGNDGLELNVIPKGLHYKLSSQLFQPLYPAECHYGKCDKTGFYPFFILY